MDRNEKMRLSARMLILFALTFVLVIGCIVAVPFTSEAANKKVTVIFEVNDDNGQKKRVANMEFELYKVGSIDGDKVVLNNPYNEMGIGADVDIHNNNKMLKSSKALYDKIKVNKAGENPKTLKTDSNGETTFEGDIGSGYLLATDKVATVGDDFYKAFPMCFDIKSNKNDIYIKPDSGHYIPPTDNEITCKVVKQWTNDSASTRPKSIDVIINKVDNETGKDENWKTVKLNSGNNWTYKWKYTSTDKNRIDWRVVEKDVLDQYTYTSKKTTDKNSVIFTLTNNKKKPVISHSGSGSHGRYTRTRSTIGSVKTGDPTQLRWFLTAMILSGVVLLLLAVRESRRRAEE